MKPLSEALMDLAARVNRLEDSTATVREQKSAALQARREQAEGAIDWEVKEVEQTAADAPSAAHSWWLRSAWEAEQRAVAAITLASYRVDAAEWAVPRLPHCGASSPPYAGANDMRQPTGRTRSLQ